jgi:hypothetical protein
LTTEKVEKKDCPFMFLDIQNNPLKDSRVSIMRQNKIIPHQ